MKDRVSIKRFLAFLLCAAMLVMYMPSPRLAFADETAGAETAAAVEEPTPEPVVESAPAPADAEPSGGSDGGEDLDAEVPAEGEEKPSGEVSGDVEGKDTEEQGDTLDGEAADGAIVDGEEAEDPEEEEYPAFKKSKTVDGVTITLEADKGVLPKGADFKAHRVNRDDVFAAVDERLEAEGKELVDAVAFDVTPVDKDGNEIHQPKGSVKVTFSGTGLDSGNVDVFRVSDDAGSVTEMGTSIANANTQQFNTNHFTIYVSASTGTIDEAHNGDNNGDSVAERYILEFNDTITLISDKVPRKWYQSEDWAITAGGSYITWNKDDRTVKNDKNLTENDIRCVVRHYYYLEWDDFGFEYFYITLKPQKFTVKFYLQDVGEDSFNLIPAEKGGECEVYRGQAATPPSSQYVPETKEGYTLYGWYTDENCETEAVLTGITENKNVYAKYTTDSTIRYHKNTTDDADVPDPQSGGVGTKVEIGGASRSGYSLSYWTEDPAGEGEQIKPGTKVTMPAEGMDLYAQWQKSELNILYFTGNYDNRPWRTKSAPQNSRTEIIEESPTSGGEVFLGWGARFADEPDYYPGDTITTGNSDIRLYAVWGDGSLNNLLTLKANDATVTYNGQEQYLYGGTVSDGSTWGKDDDFVYVGRTAFFRTGIYADVRGFRAAGTDAGQYATPVSAPLYYKVDDEMVRIDFFLWPHPFIEIEGGTLTIDPVEVSVSTGSDEGLYDGEEHTKGGTVTFKENEETKTSDFTPEGGLVSLIGDDKLNIRATGKRKDVGQATNGYEYDWGKPDGWGTERSTAKPYNYVMPSEEDADLGTLTVYIEVAFDKNCEDAVTGMPDSVKTYEPEITPDAVIPANKPSRTHYTFKGWAKSAGATTADYQPEATISGINVSETTDGVLTLYAVWEKTQYEVKFVDYDDTPIGEAKMYDSGTPKEEIDVPADPTREATAQYTYTFTGWAPELADVTEPVIYKATYKETLNQYTVTFKNDDGTVLSEEKYDYGTSAEDIKPATNPTKAEDAQYTYTFDKWDPELAEVTEDATYTATYTATAKPSPTPTPTPSGTTDDDDDDDDAGNAGGGGAAAAAAAVTPAAPADGADDIVDEPTPTTEPPATTIDDEPTPTTLTWAVVNLIMAIVTALGAVIALFRKKEDEDDEDDSADKKMLAAKIAGALAGVAAPITFFLTENMADVAVAFDKWTPLMAGILAVQVVSAVLNKTASKAADAAEEAAE